MRKMSEIGKKGKLYSEENLTAETATPSKNISWLNIIYKAAFQDKNLLEKVYKENSEKYNETLENFLNGYNKLLIEIEEIQKKITEQKKEFDKLDEKSKEIAKKIAEDLKILENELSHKEQECMRYKEDETYQEIKKLITDEDLKNLKYTIGLMKANFSRIKEEKTSENEKVFIIILELLTDTLKKEMKKFENSSDILEKALHQKNIAKLTKKIEQITKTQENDNLKENKLIEELFCKDIINKSAIAQKKINKIKKLNKRIEKELNEAVRNQLILKLKYLIEFNVLEHLNIEEPHKNYQSLHNQIINSINESRKVTPIVAKEEEKELNEDEKSINLEKNNSFISTYKPELGIGLSVTGLITGGLSAKALGIGAVASIGGLSGGAFTIAALVIVGIYLLYKIRQSYNNSKRNRELKNKLIPVLKLKSRVLKRSREIDDTKKAKSFNSKKQLRLKNGQERHEGEFTWSDSYQTSCMIGRGVLKDVKETAIGVAVISAKIADVGQDRNKEAANKFRQIGAISKIISENAGIADEFLDSSKKLLGAAGDDRTDDISTEKLCELVRTAPGHEGQEVSELAKRIIKGRKVGHYKYLISSMHPETCDIISEPPTKSPKRKKLLKKKRKYIDTLIENLTKACENLNKEKNKNFSDLGFDSNQKHFVFPFASHTASTEKASMYVLMQEHDNGQYESIYEIIEALSILDASLQENIKILTEDDMIKIIKVRNELEQILNKAIDKIKNIKKISKNKTKLSDKHQFFKLITINSKDTNRKYNFSQINTNNLSFSIIKKYLSNEAKNHLAKEFMAELLENSSVENTDILLRKLNLFFNNNIPEGIDSFEDFIKNISLKNPKYKNVELILSFIEEENYKEHGIVNNALRNTFERLDSEAVETDGIQFEEQIHESLKAYLAHSSEGPARDKEQEETLESLEILTKTISHSGAKLFEKIASVLPSKLDNVPNFYRPEIGSWGTPSYKTVHSNSFLKKILELDIDAIMRKNITSDDFEESLKFLMSLANIDIDNFKGLINNHDIIYKIKTIQKEMTTIEAVYTEVKPLLQELNDLLSMAQEISPDFETDHHNKIERIKSLITLENTKLLSHKMVMNIDEIKQRLEQFNKKSTIISGNLSTKPAFQGSVIASRIAKTMKGPVSTSIMQCIGMISKNKQTMIELDEILSKSEKIENLFKKLAKDLKLNQAKEGIKKYSNIKDFLSNISLEDTGDLFEILKELSKNLDELNEITKRSNSKKDQKNKIVRDMAKIYETAYSAISPKIKQIISYGEPIQHILHDFKEISLTLVDIKQAAINICGVSEYTSIQDLIKILKNKLEESDGNFEKDKQLISFLNIKLEQEIKLLKDHIEQLPPSGRKNPMVVFLKTKISEAERLKNSIEKISDSAIKEIGKVKELYKILKKLYDNSMSSTDLDTFVSKLMVAQSTNDLLAIIGKEFDVYKLESLQPVIHETIQELEKFNTLKKNKGDEYLLHFTDKFKETLEIIENEILTDENIAKIKEFEPIQQGLIAFIESACVEKNDKSIYEQLQDFVKKGELSLKQMDWSDMVSMKRNIHQLSHKIDEFKGFPSGKIFQPINEIAAKAAVQIQLIDKELQKIDDDKIKDIQDKYIEIKSLLLQIYRYARTPRDSEQNILSLLDPNKIQKLFSELEPEHFDLAKQTLIRIHEISNEAELSMSELEKTLTGDITQKAIYFSKKIMQQTSFVSDKLYNSCDKVKGCYIAIKTSKRNVEKQLEKLAEIYKKHSSKASISSKNILSFLQNLTPEDLFEIMTSISNKELQEVLSIVRELKLCQNDFVKEISKVKENLTGTPLKILETIKLAATQSETIITLIESQTTNLIKDFKSLEKILTEKHKERLNSKLKTLEKEEKEEQERQRKLELTIKINQIKNELENIETADILGYRTLSYHISGKVSSLVKKLLSTKQDQLDEILLDFLSLENIDETREILEHVGDSTALLGQFTGIEKVSKNIKDSIFLLSSELKNGNKIKQLRSGLIEFNKYKSEVLPLLSNIREIFKDGVSSDTENIIDKIRSLNINTIKQNLENMEIEDLLELAKNVHTFLEKSYLFEQSIDKETFKRIIKSVNQKTEMLYSTLKELEKNETDIIKISQKYKTLKANLEYIQDKYQIKSKESLYEKLSSFSYKDITNMLSSIDLETDDAENFIEEIIDLIDNFNEECNQTPKIHPIIDTISKTTSVSLLSAKSFLKQAKLDLIEVKKELSEGQKNSFLSLIKNHKSFINETILEISNLLEINKNEILNLIKEPSIDSIIEFLIKSRFDYEKFSKILETIRKVNNKNKETIEELDKYEFKTTLSKGIKSATISSLKVSNRSLSFFEHQLKEIQKAQHYVNTMTVLSEECLTSLNKLNEIRKSGTKEISLTTLRKLTPSTIVRLLESFEKKDLKHVKYILQGLIEHNEKTISNLDITSIRSTPSVSRRASFSGELYEIEDEEEITKTPFILDKPTVDILKKGVEVLNYAISQVEILQVNISEYSKEISKISEEKLKVENILKSILQQYLGENESSTEKLTIKEMINKVLNGIGKIQPQHLHEIENIQQLISTTLQDAVHVIDSIKSLDKVPGNPKEVFISTLTALKKQSDIVLTPLVQNIHTQSAQIEKVQQNYRKLTKLLSEIKNKGNIYDNVLSKIETALKEDDKISEETLKSLEDIIEEVIANPENHIYSKLIEIYVLSKLATDIINSSSIEESLSNMIEKHKKIDAEKKPHITYIIKKLEEFNSLIKDKNTKEEILEKITHGNIIKEIRKVASIKEFFYEITPKKLIMLLAQDDFDKRKDELHQSIKQLQESAKMLDFEQNKFIQSGINVFCDGLEKIEKMMDRIYPQEELEAIKEIYQIYQEFQLSFNDKSLDLEKILNVDNIESLIINLDFDVIFPLDKFIEKLYTFNEKVMTLGRKNSALAQFFVPIQKSITLMINHLEQNKEKIEDNVEYYKKTKYLLNILEQFKQSSSKDELGIFEKIKSMQELTFDDIFTVAKEQMFRKTIKTRKQIAKIFEGNENLENKLKQSQEDFLSNILGITPDKIEEILAKIKQDKIEETLTADDIANILITKTEYTPIKGLIKSFENLKLNEIDSQNQIIIAVKKAGIGLTDLIKSAEDSKEYKIMATLYNSILTTYKEDDVENIFKKIFPLTYENISKLILDEDTGAVKKILESTKEIMLALLEKENHDDDILKKPEEFKEGEITFDELKYFLDINGTKYHIIIAETLQVINSSLESYEEISKTTKEIYYAKKLTIKIKEKISRILSKNNNTEFFSENLTPNKIKGIIYNISPEKLDLLLEYIEELKQANISLQTTIASTDESKLSEFSKTIFSFAKKASKSANNSLDTIKIIITPIIDDGKEFLSIIQETNHEINLLMTELQEQTGKKYSSIPELNIEELFNPSNIVQMPNILIRLKEKQEELKERITKFSPSNEYSSKAKQNYLKYSEQSISILEKSLTKYEEYKEKLEGVINTDEFQFASKAISMIVKKDYEGLVSLSESDYLKEIIKDKSKETELSKYIPYFEEIISIKYLILKNKSTLNQIASLITSKDKSIVNKIMSGELYDIDIVLNEFSSESIDLVIELLESNLKEVQKAMTHQSKILPHIENQLTQGISLFKSGKTILTERFESIKNIKKEVKKLNQIYQKLLSLSGDSSKPNDINILELLTPENIKKIIENIQPQNLEKTKTILKELSLTLKDVSSKIKETQIGYTLSSALNYTSEITAQIEQEIDSVSDKLIEYNKAYTTIIRDLSQIEPPDISSLRKLSLNSSNLLELAMTSDENLGKLDAAISSLGQSMQSPVLRKGLSLLSNQVKAAKTFLTDNKETLKNLMSSYTKLVSLSKGGKETSSIKDLLEEIYKNPGENLTKIFDIDNIEQVIKELKNIDKTLKNLSSNQNKIVSQTSKQLLKLSSPIVELLSTKKYDDKNESAETLSQLIFDIEVLTKEKNIKYNDELKTLFKSCENISYLLKNSGNTQGMFQLLKDGAFNIYDETQITKELTTIKDTLGKLEKNKDISYKVKEINTEIEKLSILIKEQSIYEKLKATQSLSIPVKQLFEEIIASPAKAKELYTKFINSGFDFEKIIYDLDIDTVLKLSKKAPILKKYIPTEESIKKINEIIIASKNIAKQISGYSKETYITYQDILSNPESIKQFILSLDKKTAQYYLAEMKKISTSGINITIEDDDSDYIKLIKSKIKLFSKNLNDTVSSLEKIVTKIEEVSFDVILIQKEIDKIINDIMALSNIANLSKQSFLEQISKGDLSEILKSIPPQNIFKINNLLRILTEKNHEVNMLLDEKSKKYSDEQAQSIIKMLQAGNNLIISGTENLIEHTRPFLKDCEKVKSVVNELTKSYHSLSTTYQELKDMSNNKAIDITSRLQMYSTTPSLLLQDFAISDIGKVVNIIKNIESESLKLEKTLEKIEPTTPVSCFILSHSKKMLKQTNSHIKKIKLDKMIEDLGKKLTLYEKFFKEIASTYKIILPKIELNSMQDLKSLDMLNILFAEKEKIEEFQDKIQEILGNKDYHSLITSGHFSFIKQVLEESLKAADNLKQAENLKSICNVFLNEENISIESLMNITPESIISNINSFIEKETKKIRAQYQDETEDFIKKRVKHILSKYTEKIIERLNEDETYKIITPYLKKGHEIYEAIISHHEEIKNIFEKASLILKEINLESSEKEDLLSKFFPLTKEKVYYILENISPERLDSIIEYFQEIKNVTEKLESCSEPIKNFAKISKKVLEETISQLESPETKEIIKNYTEMKQSLYRLEGVLEKSSNYKRYNNILETINQLSENPSKFFSSFTLQEIEDAFTQIKVIQDEINNAISQMEQTSNKTQIKASIIRKAKEASISVDKIIVFAQDSLNTAIEEIKHKTKIFNAYRDYYKSLEKNYSELKELIPQGTSIKSILEAKDTKSLASILQTCKKEDIEKIFNVLRKIRSATTNLKVEIESEKHLTIHQTTKDLLEYQVINLENLASQIEKLCSSEDKIESILDEISDIDIIRQLIFEITGKESLSFSKISIEKIMDHLMQNNEEKLNLLLEKFDDSTHPIIVKIKPLIEIAKHLHENKFTLNKLHNLTFEDLVDFKNEDLKLLQELAENENTPKEIKTMLDSTIQTLTKYNSAFVIKGSFEKLIININKDIENLKKIGVTEVKNSEDLLLAIQLTFSKISHLDDKSTADNLINVIQILNNNMKKEISVVEKSLSEEPFAHGYLTFLRECDSKLKASLVIANKFKKIKALFSKQEEIKEQLDSINLFLSSLEKNIGNIQTLDSIDKALLILLKIRERHEFIAHASKELIDSFNLSDTAQKIIEFKEKGLEVIEKYEERLLTLKKKKDEIESIYEVAIKTASSVEKIKSNVEDIFKISDEAIKKISSDDPNLIIEQMNILQIQLDKIDEFQRDLEQSIQAIYVLNKIKGNTDLPEHIKQGLASQTGAINRNAKELKITLEEKKIELSKLYLTDFLKRIEMSSSMKKRFIYLVEKILLSGQSAYASQRHVEELKILYNNVKLKLRDYNSNKVIKLQEPHFLQGLEDNLTVKHGMIFSKSQKAGVSSALRHERRVSMAMKKEKGKF